MKHISDIGGVWRTIAGRKVFIKDGQSLTDAMRESKKFKLESSKKRFDENLDELIEGKLKRSMIFLLK